MDRLAASYRCRGLYEADVRIDVHRIGSAFVPILNPDGSIFRALGPGETRQGRIIEMQNAIQKSLYRENTKRYTELGDLKAALENMFPEGVENVG
jgi:hypothetical protein